MKNNRTVVKSSSMVFEMFNGGDTKKQAEKKVWSIPVGIVVNAMTASNAIGTTAISREALGAPLRLAIDAKTNEVKFTDKGEPRIVVAKEINDAVKAMRENFIARLVTETNSVITNPETADLYKAEAAACVKAGKPIIASDAILKKNAIAKRDAELVKAAIEHANATVKDDSGKKSEPASKPASEPARELSPVA